MDQEKNAILAGRAVRNFYDQRDIVEHDFKRLKEKPDAYGKDETKEIVIDHLLYQRVSTSLSDMRKVIREKKDLPDEIKQLAFDILLNVDNKEKRSETLSQTVQLKTKIIQFLQ